MIKLKRYFLVIVQCPNREPELVVRTKLIEEIVNESFLSGHF